MSQVTVGRWGRSLAVRLPGDVASAAGVEDGARVEIEAEAGVIVIRPAMQRRTLAELFADRSAAEWRAEYAAAFDWGPDVGREVVDP